MLSKRIISVILVVVTILSFSTAAHAAGEYTSTGTFWTSVSDSWYAGILLQPILGLTCASVCPTSPDSLHHGKLISYKPNRDGSFTARCDYCSDVFLVYDADLSAAYDTYVDSVYQDHGGVRVDSAGGWYLVPKPKECWLEDSAGYGHYVTLPSSSFNFSYSFTPSESTKGYAIFYLTLDFSSFPSSMVGTLYFEKITAGPPYTCSYVPSGSVANIGMSDPLPVYASAEATSSFSCKPGSSVRVGPGWHVGNYKVVCLLGKMSADQYYTFSANADFLHNRFYFVPETTSVPDSSTRPGSLVGLYGDISGEAFSNNSFSIVSEAEKTLYNPVTNTTSNITDWQYDYSTRTYTVTLDTGTTQTITYGDEHVTIAEGDTTYNVYYLMDDSGSGTPGPDTPTACEHTYTSAVTTAPSCTVPGTETYTCSKCNHAYTQSIPATGHSWTVKQQVATEYDDTGTLVREGYTLYECSVCHEQYKDSAGAGPPGKPGGGDPGSPTTIGGLVEKLLSSVGSVVGGIIKGLLSLLTKAVEALSGIGDLFTQFVESVVTLFSGFTEFLTAVFPFLPQEFFTIFSLGVLLLVAAAVLRKFLS